MSHMTGMSVATVAGKPALRAWLPGLVGLAAIWGCSFLFIGVGVRELHPACHATGWHRGRRGAKATEHALGMPLWS
jgi:hypothetical protein